MIRKIIEKAILDSDKTQYQIAKETGLAQSVLTRFLQGSGLNLENLDILCDYFGLELTEKKGKTRRKRG